MDFSGPEQGTLGSLIASMEYKELVASETTYYRAYWLATKLDRPKTQALGLLLSAIWQVSPGDMSGASTEKSSAALRRYQELFVREANRASSALQASDRVWIKARAANAARQLGRFREAAQLRKLAEEALTEMPDKRGWDIYLTKLQAVISRRDNGVEPLDMIPEQQIALTCIRRPPSNAFDRRACTNPVIAGRIGQLRKVQQQHGATRP
jgi:hypothetical protein